LLGAAMAAHHGAVNVALAKILRVDLDNVDAPHVAVVEDDRAGAETNIKRELQSLIATGTRFKRALHPYIEAYDDLVDVMHWKNPVVSGMLFAYYVLCCFQGILFAGAVLLAIVAIAATGEGEGIFSPPGEAPEEGQPGAAAGAGAAPQRPAAAAGDHPELEQPPPPAGSEYPSTAAAAGAPTSPPRRKGLFAGLTGGLTGLVQKGVTTVADSFHGLHEARVVARKIRTLLHPATLTLEKIALLFNWRVPYNTRLVLAGLSFILVVSRTFPWWQVDLMMKVAVGYVLFVPGLIRWVRGRRGRKGPVDIFWDTLPTQGNTSSHGTASSPTSPDAPSPNVRRRGLRIRQGSGDAPAEGTRSANSADGGATAPSAAVPPPRPPPPAVAEAESPRESPYAAATTAAEAESKLGTWAMVHTNSKKKASLVVTEGHIGLFFRSGEPAIVVPYSDVLSVSKPSIALVITVLDPESGDAVTHRLMGTATHTDEARRVLADRLGQPVGDGADAAVKDKSV